MYTSQHKAKNKKEKENEKCNKFYYKINYCCCSYCCFFPLSIRNNFVHCCCSSAASNSIASVHIFFCFSIMKSVFGQLSVRRNRWFSFWFEICRIGKGKSQTKSERQNRIQLKWCVLNCLQAIVGDQWVCYGAIVSKRCLKHCISIKIKIWKQHGQAMSFAFNLPCCLPLIDPHDRFKISSASRMNIDNSSKKKRTPIKNIATIDKNKHFCQIILSERCNQPEFHVSLQQQQQQQPKCLN